MIIKQLTLGQIILINKSICLEDDHLHQILDQTKIESALYTTFYPGSEPFVHGGIARLAGALAYYITNAHGFLDGNKRTALLASTLFMRVNNYTLNYPLKVPHHINALGEAILSASSGKIGIEELKDWYNIHKIKIK